MKRERVVQVVLAFMGLFYLSWIIPLFQGLWHSAWIQGNLEAQTMFVSVNTVLGVFLLLAVNQPAQHRSLIAFGAWSSLAHASTMAIQTVEARAHGIPRSPLDVVVIGTAAVVLFALLAVLSPPSESRAL
ncbi:MAG TPA: DUF6632 domain-containing protein [Gemmatimonadales bacterium]|jgi:hypothetical protein|nr:DUF6632 domain-containing protein [Gemmatimonadales bacterium]